MNDTFSTITIFIQDDQVYIDLPPQIIRIKDKKLPCQILNLLQISSLKDHVDQESYISATTFAVITEAANIKPVLIPYQKSDYAYEGTRIPLKNVNETLPSITISEILSKRRSQRFFGPIDFSTLSNLLFHSARVRDIWISPDNYKATSRAAPTAGGRHPIDLLCVINEVDGLNAGIYIFEPFSCELIEISNSNEAQEELNLEAFTRFGENSIPPVIIFFVAQLHRTFTRYPGGITFVIVKFGRNAFNCFDSCHCVEFAFLWNWNVWITNNK